MKQYKVLVRSITTGKEGWNNVHANSEQEAGEKVYNDHKGNVEIMRVVKHGRKKR